MKALSQRPFSYITAFVFIFCFFRAAGALEAPPPDGLKMSPSQEDAPPAKIHIHDLMPQLVVLDSMADLYEAVEFDHEMHAIEVGCAKCHHHIIEHIDPSCAIHNVVDQTNDPFCARCHKGWFPGSLNRAKCRDCHSSHRYTADYINKIGHDKKIYHRDNIGLMGAYHNQCMRCHLEEGIGGCQDCHARTETGDTMHGPKPATGDFGSKPEHQKQKQNLLRPASKCKDKRL